MTFHNNLTTKLEYRTTRVLNLSMTSIQIAEAISRDWVIGFAYRINDFKFFGLNRHRQVKGKKNSADEQKAQVSRQTAGKKGTVNHDLNMRLDISYRKQASITRDISLDDLVGFQRKHRTETFLRCRLYTFALADHDVLLRPADQPPFALQQFLPHHHTRLRSFA